MKIKSMDHDDVMELAVQLTCSYLSTSRSDTTNAEELILNYYKQIRGVEKRLGENDMGVVSAQSTDLEELEAAA